MATAAAILELRDAIGEPDDSNGWTDERLGDILDTLTTVDASAISVWTTKAAQFSQLVDVSESGSSRKLSDLYKNALAMAKFWQDKQDEDNPPIGGDGPVIRRIRRGFT